MGATGAHTVEGTLLTPTQPPHTHTQEEEGGRKEEERREGERREGGG